MGGRHGKWAKIIHDPRNVCLLAKYWHDVLDRRVILEDETRTKLLLFVKLRTDWYSWARENEIFIKEEI
jgi:hypothetical protein